MLVLSGFQGVAQSPPPTSTPRQKVVLVAFDGNSLSGAPGGVQPYPSRIDFHGIPSINVAAQGNSTTDQDGFAPKNLDPHYNPAGVNLLVMWEGANDLYFGASADQAIANLQTYVAHRHAVGFKVMLGTLLPRGDVGLSPDYEARRQAVNAWIRAKVGTVTEGLIDYAADPDMGPDGAEFNPRFFLPDHVHLADGGAQRIASIAQRALDPWLTGAVDIQH
jgi:lysophospholipase L1-like esterase